MLRNISSKKSSNALGTILDLKFKVKDRREGRREISLIGFRNPLRRGRISLETDLGIHTKLPEAAAPESVTTPSRVNPVTKARPSTRAATAP
jgi:hypothetical protein